MCAVRRQLLLGLAAILVAAGCTTPASVQSSTTGLPTTIRPAATTTTTADADETPSPSALGATPPPAAATVPAVTSGACRAGDPLANVYHPYRLHVVKPCLTVTGTVVAVRDEADGDIHINIRLDPPDAGLINDRNVSGEGGALVAEIVPADEPGCPPGQPPRPAGGTYDYGVCTGADEAAPAVGTHASVTGPYVLDADHGWMEIHPVWAIGPAGAAAPGPPPAPTTTVAAPPANQGVQITSAPTSVAPGDTASLGAQTSPGATCSLGVTLPSGAQSRSSGLGATTADAGGRLQWTWRIGTTTKPGTATATVSCPGGSASVEFQIT